MASSKNYTRSINRRKGFLLLSGFESEDYFTESFYISEP